jgi:ferredoxin
MKQLQFVEVERPCGQEFIHRAHHYNDFNEFHAIAAERDDCGAMANKHEKNPGNVPGPFYVDSSCIDCDMCRETAPETFRRNDEIGFSIAYQQPLTPQQIEAATEAMVGCPTESIGNDG